MLLKGKVAIITGGGSGIGKAITLKFAKEGAIVVIADIDKKKAYDVASEVKSLGGKAMAIQTNVSNKESVGNLVESTIGTFNCVDILVNNAGVLHSTLIEDITEEEWDRVFAVNMKGTFLCSQAVLPSMKKKREGRIINMSSNAGRNGGVSTGLAYAASKASIIGFTYGLAKQIAEYGITCNCIAPGTTQSDMINLFTPEMIHNIVEAIPLKRLGKPEEIAELACFIASKNGAFMTGAVIDINGGMFIG